MTTTKKKAAPCKPGRPTLYTPAITEAVCVAIIDGHTLREIDQMLDMPSKATILRWLENHAGFRAQYARARELQAEVMDAKILDAAEECTPENHAAQRVKIEAYKWRAAKLNPKVYGDKIDLNHSGDLNITARMEAAEKRLRANREEKD